MGHRKGPWLAGALPDTWTAWTPGRLISKTKDLGHSQPHCFFRKVTTFCARSVSGVSRLSGLGLEASLRSSTMRLRVLLVSRLNSAAMPIFRKVAAASRNRTLKAEGSRGQDRHRETDCSVRSPSVRELRSCGRFRASGPCRP